MCTVDSLYATSSLFFVASFIHVRIRVQYQCALREDISSSTKALTRQAIFFQLISTQLMPAVFPLSAATTFSFSFFTLFYFCSFSFDRIRNENVLVKLTWTLRRSSFSFLFDLFIHSFRCKQRTREKEERHPRATNRDWKYSFLLFHNLSSALLLLDDIYHEFMEERRVSEREREKDDVEECLVLVFYSDPNCWSSDLVVV